MRLPYESPLCGVHINFPPCTGAYNQSFWEYLSASATIMFKGCTQSFESSTLQM